MVDERWVHVGRDADGEVYVSEGVDLEGMREVRLGDGRRERFRPDGPIPWLDTLTHWTVAPSEVTYVAEEGEPAPAPWRLLGPVEGTRSASIVIGDGQAFIAPAGTPAPVGQESWVETLRLAQEYVERRDAGSPPSITCPRCHRTSYNPNDIREGYCGACHRFEDDASPPAYPRRNIQWHGTEEPVTMSHDFSTAPPGLDDDDD